MYALAAPSLSNNVTSCADRFVNPMRDNSSVIKYLFIVLVFNECQLRDKNNVFIPTMFYTSKSNLFFTNLEDF